MIYKAFRSLLSTPRHNLYSKIKPVLDVEYLLNPDNVPEISNNIILRKGVGDIGQVQDS